MTVYECKCGKGPLDGTNALKGHVRFSAGDGHGERMELPDDWRELGEPIENDADDESGNEPDASGGESDPEPETDETDGNGGGRLRKALTDDVRHLWGGA